MKAIVYVAGLFVLLFTVFITTAIAQDISGSRDHALVKRYEGPDIIKYNHNSFDVYTIPVGPSKNSETLENVLEIEGAVTRLTYKAPLGRSVLEVVRNYENELKEQGFQVIHQGAKDHLGHGFAEAAGYRKIQMPPNIPIFYLNEDSQRFMALERACAEDVDIYVVLFDMAELFWAADLKDVKKGQVLIQVDVIETKLMEKKMVTVTAEEIAQQVAASGGVALYGIYFDFNKAGLKPESKPTLQEMANFLSYLQKK